MKKTLITLATCALAFSYYSCSGCVKKTTKKATELSLSAVEGVVEALDEHGEAIAEKTTDAAGKVAAGVTKSIGKQLEEHAHDVFASTGKILIKSVDGLAEGTKSEMTQYYDTLSYSANLDKGIEVQYIAKYKHGAVIDTYIKLPTSGKYDYNFTCLNEKKDILISKNVRLEKTADDKRTYTLVSIGLDYKELNEYDKSNNIEISIKKSNK